jgi:hypothetical protein
MNKEILQEIKIREEELEDLILPIKASIILNKKYMDNSNNMAKIGMSYVGGMSNEEIDSLSEREEKLNKELNFLREIKIILEDFQELKLENSKLACLNSFLKSELFNVLTEDQIKLKLKEQLLNLSKENQDLDKDEIERVIDMLL